MTSVCCLLHYCTESAERFRVPDDPNSEPRNALISQDPPRTCLRYLQHPGTYAGTDSTYVGKPRLGPLLHCARRGRIHPLRGRMSERLPRKHSQGQRWGRSSRRSSQLGSCARAPATARLLRGHVSPWRTWNPKQKRYQYTDLSHS